MVPVYPVRPAAPTFRAIATLLAYGVESMIVGFRAFAFDKQPRQSISFLDEFVRSSSQLLNSLPMELDY